MIIPASSASIDGLQVGQGPVTPGQVAGLEIFTTLARTEISQWIQGGCLMFVLLTEPDLVTAKDLLIEDQGFMRCKDQQ